MQIVAFLRGWDLSLVVLAAIPALVITGAVCGIFTARLQAKASRAYSRAGGIAQEAVANIRTVAAFGREEATLKNYAAELGAPTRVRVATYSACGFWAVSSCSEDGLLACWHCMQQPAAFELHPLCPCLLRRSWGSGRACWEGSPWESPTLSFSAPMLWPSGTAAAAWQQGSWTAGA